MPPPPPPGVATPPPSSAGTSAPPPFTNPFTSGRTAPIPPPPVGGLGGGIKTYDELALEALLALETALKAKLRENPALKTAELQKHFDKYNNIKARGLRGVGGEAITGMKMALKAAIDLVYS